MNSSNSNVFYASVCHSCKKFSSNLKQCSGCKTFFYCSKEHQKEDWHQHKQLCKVIHRTNDIISYKVGCSMDEWKEYRLKLQFIWRNLLKRELLTYEEQVWMFPRVCAQCFSKENLKDCSECMNAAYCCVEHEKTQRNVHEKVCAKLKLCMDIDRLFISNEKQYPIMKRLPHSMEVDELFPENINEILFKYFGESDEDSIDFILKSDVVSSFGIIASVLHKFVDIKKLNNLICHIVGAATYEAFTDWSTLSQNLFHIFPTIKSIEWILVGPEADYHTFEDSFCDFCIKENRRFSISTHKALYGKVINKLPMPELVIAFNSGIHEFVNRDCNMWKDSIPYLLKQTGVPLLLTAYTKSEILQDLRCIDDYIKIKILMDAQVNKYASLKPIRDWDAEETTVSVFYTNGYISVVEKDS